MFNARMRFEKTGYAKYISHLDTMHLFQRAFQRAELPLSYTEGFNPHPYVSILLPLPTSFAGLDEIIDFDLSSDSLPDDILSRINQALPEGFRAKEIGQAVTKPKGIEYAGYRIKLFIEDMDAQKAVDAINAFFERDEILITKRTKSGQAVVNVKDFIKSIRAENENGEVILRTTLSAGTKNLNPEYLVGAITDGLFPGNRPDALYTRTAILNGALEIFR